MLECINLPSQLITGGEVQKYAIDGIDEIQYLFVAPHTVIDRHGHNPGQWEIWIDCENKLAKMCQVGKEHSLTNKSDKSKMILAIKGHNDTLDFDDFSNLLAAFDVVLSYGDMILL